MTRTHKLTLAFPWRDEDGKHGCEEIEIQALRERKHYGDLGDREMSRRRAGAKQLAFASRSVVVFMDVTGFRRSTAWKTAFPPDGCYPSCFDHARVWMEPMGHAFTRGGALSKHYVVTADPYSPAHEETLAWCAAKGWPCEVMPAGFGMWYPPGPHGTRLVLASPPEVGAPIARLMPGLVEHMPRWE